MNYEQFDLNLLAVFDAVMTELNVTRAAERLHMTQPAVSNALKRLRHLLNDELFVKVPTGVSPTPKAIEIWHPIRDALAQIYQTLQPAKFDPATATVTFTIAMNDLTANLVLPKLIAVVEKSAPNINIRAVPSTHINAPMLLEQAEIDLAIGVFAKPNSRLRSHTLFISPFTCAMRRDHPLANQQMTLEDYIQAKHLLVTLTGESTRLLEPILQERGLKRRIALTVNHFGIAPRLVACSDLLCVLPTRIVEMSEFFSQLHLTPLPIEIVPSIVKMMWHERNHLNLAQEWLRSCLGEICTSL